MLQQLFQSFTSNIFSHGLVGADLAPDDLLEAAHDPLGDGGSPDDNAPGQALVLRDSVSIKGKGGRAGNGLIRSPVNWWKSFETAYPVCLHESMCSHQGTSQDQCGFIGRPTGRRWDASHLFLDDHGWLVRRDGTDLA